MQRKVYCSCDSNLKNFFNYQVGSGFNDINVFRGAPYQRGHGIGSLIGRFGIPILKFLGKHVLKTGVNVGADLLEKKKFKDALKARAKETLKNATSESINKVNQLLQQSGTGLRRRKRPKRSRKRLYKTLTKTKPKRKVTRRKKRPKRRKKDIFQ